MIYKGIYKDILIPRTCSTISSNRLANQGPALRSLRLASIKLLSSRAAHLSGGYQQHECM